MTLESTRVPSAMTAAAVTSQELSLPRVNITATKLKAVKAVDKLAAGLQVCLFCKFAGLEIDFLAEADAEVMSFLLSIEKRT